MTDKLTTIKPITDTKSYVTDMKDNHRKDVIEIGDVKQTDQCYPQAKFKQWGNETNFSIRLNEDVTDSTNELKDGKFIWKAKDEKTEAHLYELDSTSCFDCEDGGFEFEVILHEKPKSNIIEYTIQTKGLDFFYQPELTDEEKKRGNKRPENVVGSYAVYHSSKSNTGPHGDYRTGKAFHIYRPVIFDAQDSTAWCVLNIDTTAELLTITVPQDFIDNAVYPITIDPTFGNTTGGSSQSSYNNNQAKCFKATAPVNATVQSISAYTYWYGGSYEDDAIKAVIWDGVSENVLTNAVGAAEEIAVGTPDWVVSTFGTDPIITSGDQFYYGIVQYKTSTLASQNYDSSNSYASYYDSSNNYSSPVNINPTLSTVKYSIYITYTEIIDPVLKYRKSAATTTIKLYSSEDGGWDDSLRVRSQSATWYCPLCTNLASPNMSDLRVRIGGVTYGAMTETGTCTGAASAFAEAFFVEDTDAATNRTHTTEADVDVTAAATTEEGDWSGQWTGPDLTLPEDNLYLIGYCDFLRASGTIRSGSLCQLEIDGTKLGAQGVSSWGYIRVSGGADEATRHMVSLYDGTLNEVATIREATQLNTSDRIGDYDRTAGDPRGMWALNLKGASDYLMASSSTRDYASGVIGNSPRPIDLGTPSSLTSGTWQTVTWSATEASSGTSVTRSSNTFTVAANKIVLCNFNFETWGTSNRKTLLMRMDIDGSPYAYSTVYHRNAAMEGCSGSITIPIITGGSSVTVDFSFVDQAETTSELNMDIIDKWISFVDFTGQDIAFLGKTDADITGIDGSTPDIPSWPVADEIQVDSSFDHPVGNLTRISNDSGGSMTVLAGFTFLADKSVATASNRQFPTAQLKKTGTLVDYCIAGETQRGAQSADDTFVGGASFCAPVVLGTSDYLELSLRDAAGNTGGSMINCTDDCALYMWAIRIDN